MYKYANILIYCVHIDTRMDTTSMIMFIDKYVNDLEESERLIVLEMILNVIDGEKTYKKTGGTQIRYTDMPDDLIKSIYEYINNVTTAKKNIIKMN